MQVLIHFISFKKAVYVIRSERICISRIFVQVCIITMETNLMTSCASPWRCRVWLPQRSVSWSRVLNLPTLPLRATRPLKQTLTSRSGLCLLHMSAAHVWSALCVLFLSIVRACDGRFMVDSNVVGCCWIELPKGKYQLREERREGQTDSKYPGKVKNKM